MPRKPRIDCPGLLYHVIARGIERRLIFKDEEDKDFFLLKMGGILKESQTPIFAFALIPNHFHLLLMRGATPISKVMQRLLTSYAIYFNKRHKRAGHLFQNRYKAIICQQDRYLLELIRYIHLNPLRAHLVDSITNLCCYPYSGHSYILGKQKADWFNCDAILSYFGQTKNEAKSRYIKFVLDGASMVRRADLVSGNPRKSSVYPKERLGFDSRVLGDAAFIEKILSRLKGQLNSDEEPKERRSSPPPSVNCGLNYATVAGTFTSFLRSFSLCSI